MTASVEACVVGYGNASTIAACVESLALVPGVRIAVCDNHPARDTVAPAVAAAGEAGLSIRVESRPDNPGFAVACNQLARSSTADWLFFLNPDAAVTEWPAGWLPSDHGIVAPVITDAAGREQRIYGRRRTVWNELWLRLQIPPREPNGSGYVSGAALLVPRRLFADVGGFDEGYFMYYEDIDLCARIADAGGTVRRTHDVRVSHLGAYSARRLPAETALRSYGSARRYHATWGHSTRGFDAVVVADCLARVVLRRLGLSVPGAEGAGVVLGVASANLRRRAPSGG